VKWGIEHMKVTLRDESGETVVIEQSKDGAIRCEQAGGAPRPTPPEPARPPQEPKPAPASPAARDAEPRAKSPSRGRPRGSGKRAARPARPAAAPAPAPTTSGSLEWVPTRDGKAWGVLARSGAGQFKILRSATSTWSLFFERLDANGNLAAFPEPLGCFPIGMDHKARARAQEHHDRGMHITANMADVVYDLCPAPTPGSAEATRTRRARSTKPAEPGTAEPGTAAPGRDAEPEVDPAMDAAIMGGLDAILKKHLDGVKP